MQFTWFGRTPAARLPRTPPPRSARGRVAACLLALTAVLLLASPAHAGQDAERGGYRIGPHDILQITVYGRTELSGRFDVGADGTFVYPLLGRIPAAGLPESAVRDELRKRLANGYLRNPEVAVSVEQYRSQRIFVVGEVRQPGTYPLAGTMTVLEALTRAGFLSADAARTALVLRAGAPAGAEPEPVDLDDLRSGNAASMVLEDGDTVLVPRSENVYVFGHVRTPGAYAYRPRLTVLELLALAGGITERGSDQRLRIVRTIEGKRREIRARLNDLVQPGDTVKVPERFF